MKLYSIVISLTIAAIIALNFAINGIFYTLETWQIILFPLISFVGVVAIDGLFAFLIRRLPEKWFNYRVKFFDVSKKEQKFYEKLGIKRWKDKVLELGMFTHFSKRKVADPRDNAYIERFLLESNYGFIIHATLSVVGFTVIFLLPLKVWFSVGLIIGIVNAVLNMMSGCILRYNTRKLLTLHKFNERKNKAKISDESKGENIL